MYHAIVNDARTRCESAVNSRLRRSSGPSNHCPAGATGLIIILCSKEEIALATLLVVDDELKLRELLREYFQQAGFSIRTVATGEAALADLDRAPVDLVILDWMLPDMEGLEVTRRIRQRGKIPIIMLTARAEEADRVVGLEMGADDYVVKPFSPRELLARVKAVLRRAGEEDGPSAKLKIGPFLLDEAARELYLDGRLLELTAMEFNLIAYLLHHPRRVFSRIELLRALAGNSYAVFPRTIDAHIKKLRQKLEPDLKHPRYLITVHSVGYKLVIPPETPSS